VSKRKEYTTIAIDKYGRVYDLSKVHPSWEQSKEGSESMNIIVNALTCPVEDISKYGKPKKSKKKKKNVILHIGISYLDSETK